METNNRKYLIIDVSEINEIDFSLILETSIDTLRYNTNNTKTLIKWIDDVEPDFISNLTTKEGPYNYEEIKELLNKEEWN
jgi:hypothetical protein